jgi:predicted GNAT family acetyltransferase
MIDGTIARQPVLDTATGRYVLVEDGATAVLNFVVTEDQLVIEHVVVPDEIGARGIGGALVATAVARANDEGLTVVPRCPFARHWLRSHPEVAAATRIDWNSRPPS